MVKVLTAGVYNLLHVGHVELFRRAKKLGDYLTVAVQDSRYIALFKPGAVTVESTDVRCYMVKSIRYVDNVIVYTDILSAVQTADFDIFVKGPDQKHEGFVAAVKRCEEHGKTVITLPRTEGVSSSAIKQKIKSLAI